MSDDFPTVQIKVDLERHTRPPENPGEDISWATLDTVRTILRQGVARLALYYLREEAAEQDLEVPPEDVLLRDLDVNCLCGRAKHSLDDLSVDLDGDTSYELASLFSAMGEATYAMLKSLSIRVENPGEER
jgi:hypothetical protein